MPRSEEAGGGRLTSPVGVPAAAAAAAAAAVVAYWLPAVSRIAPAARRPLAITGGGSTATVWLTFDDGPHPRGTERILDILAEHRARAVFFLVGEQVRRWPRTAARIGAEGHIVGVHCDRHRSLLRLSPRQVAGDLGPGATVLLHDSAVYCRRRDWRIAPQALEAILDGLAVRGVALERGFEATAPA